MRRASTSGSPISSPAADPLFSPSSGDEPHAAAMTAKAQPTLASFFGGKKQPGRPVPAPDAADAADAAAAPAAGPRLSDAHRATGEELVGCEVEIFWDSDKEWYSGTVQNLTAEGAHVIDYEDGSNVTHDMSKMQYRVRARPAKPQADQSSEANESASEAPAATVAAAVESTPAPLAPIFGVAKKKARVADQKPAGGQEAPAGPLAPIFGKPAKKRSPSADDPPCSSTKNKRERPAAPQQQAQDAKPTKSVPAKGGGEPPKGKVPDLFLTKKQKQERAKEESLRKLREEQERNRQADEALRKGQTTNPFFEQRAAARETAHRDDDCPQLERCDSSSPVFATIPWLLPGGVVHIAQRQQLSQPIARPVLPRTVPQGSVQPSHVPSHTRLLPLSKEREREQLSAAASPPVPSFSYRPLEIDDIETFARSLPVIKLLCGESKEYSALTRAEKVLVNTFQRCLGWRYGRIRTASGEPRARVAHDLWTIMYRPMCAADVCGNRQDVARLATWLQRMKSNMMTAKQKPKVRKYKDDSDSDYESDDFADSACNGSYARLSAKDQSELWETSTEYNVVLLTGPAGCGKSAAIHAASQECGYSIIEMNASEKRTGKAVQAKCGEATQSHGLQKWQGSAPQEISAPKNPIAKSLKRKKAGSKLALNKKAKTADANSSAGADGSAEASLIVFEEVDVLFDDDQGFFAALSTLESTTKRPIVMTSTSTSIEGLPDRLPTLNSAFEVPSPKEIRDLLRCICLAEGVDLRVDDAENLVERFHCDMRALLMDAQMRFQGEAGLLVPHKANRLARKAKQHTDDTEEPTKVKLSVENVVQAQDAHVLPASMAASDILDVTARTKWSVGKDLPAEMVGIADDIHFDEWMQGCVETAINPSCTEDLATCSSVLQDMAELGWFFSVTDVADTGGEWSSSNVGGGLNDFDRRLYLGAAMLHTSTNKLRQRGKGTPASAPEVSTTSATTSVPAVLEVPSGCFVSQSPMTLQRAAEAHGVNTLMREPHVATRASELLDYAGWAHPMAAADVLAGKTTEKRRFMYHLRSSADLTDKQVKQLGQPRFTAGDAMAAV